MRSGLKQWTTWIPLQILLVTDCAFLVIVTRVDQKLVIQVQFLYNPEIIQYNKETKKKKKTPKKKKFKNFLKKKNKELCYSKLGFFFSFLFLGKPKLIFFFFFWQTQVEFCGSLSENHLNWVQSLYRESKIQFWITKFHTEFHFGKDGFSKT